MSSNKKKCALIPLIFAVALAAPQFPALTGRVVDNANLLSAAVRSELTALFAQHEKETTNQIVVATLPGLQGYDISDFGYQLGRHWKIGQAGRNNGVILLVAPRERKVRIEVGYGLEGELTDALSQDIIQAQVLPHFRGGDYEAGILAGAKAILEVVAGTYRATSEPQRRNGRSMMIAIFLIFILIPLVLMLGGLWAPTRGARGRSGWSHSGWSSGSSSGASSWSGGGFSGGGSFGGGGASGSW